MMTRAEYDAHIARLSPAARARAGRPLEKAPEEPANEIPGIIRIPRPSNWLEKDEQRECWRLLLGLGWRVLWLSQAQRSQQSKGLPDLLARHRVRQLLLWVEVKRPDQPSEWTAFQRAFADERLSFEHYVLGTEANLRSYLEAQGFELPAASYTLP